MLDHIILTVSDVERSVSELRCMLIKAACDTMSEATSR